jgi:hypothetical protein
MSRTESGVDNNSSKRTDLAVFQQPSAGLRTDHGLHRHGQQERGGRVNAGIEPISPQLE